MKLPNAARYNALIWLAVLGGTWSILPGLRMVGVQFIRQGWLLENPMAWMAWWFWLLAIFGWMWLLIALAWTYLPAHRIASVLQSGLMLIGAVLLISGVIMWMGVLPVMATQADAAAWMLLIDVIALNLLGGGCLMGGIVTTWIGVELFQIGKFSRGWTLLCIVAGLSILPSPLLLPSFIPYHLMVAVGAWWLWSIYLALQPQLPSPFPEYSSSV